MSSPVVDAGFRIEIGNHPDCPRAQPYSASAHNISALSFGCLSANAIQPHHIVRRVSRNQARRGLSSAVRH